MKSQGLLYRLFHQFLLLWQKPWAAVLFSFLIYSLIVIQNHTWGGTSTYPYFNLLADAFLHGQLHLRLIPVDTHDLVFYMGNYYYIGIHFQQFYYCLSLLSGVPLSAMYYSL